MKITNKDGVSWFDAPLPPWVHRCRIWSSHEDGIEYIGRCACGAFASWAAGSTRTRPGVVD